MKKPSNTNSGSIKIKKTEKKKGNEKPGHITFAEGLRRIANAGKPKE